MRKWEYRRLDLNDTPRRRDEVDVLNQAGSEGWELVAVTGNRIAYLKAGDRPAAEARAW